ncbi:MAG: hypothetical protein AAGF89_02360 [Bacteroidota bacterium]
MKPYFLLCALLMSIISCRFGDSNEVAPTPTKRIQPWQDNPRYWAWEGEDPVLLLGAGSNDNLFQSANYYQELGALAKAGGNYIRCTMSSRDEGDRWPFARNPATGQYDLSNFDSTYWANFAGLLARAAELDIVVQVEIWDRFDYSRSPWQLNPFNPLNNPTFPIGGDSLMSSVYPLHPSSDVQPFFHTMAGLPLYRPELEALRSYQEGLVDQLLAISLPYGNVLYCINNETSTPPAWGHYWADYVHQKAREDGKRVYVTDMFDNFYRPQQCHDCLAAIQDTTHYDFIDISQVNGRHFQRNHWDTVNLVLSLAKAAPARPANCTKVYGGGNSGWGSGTNADGIARFNRDLLAGVASVRHHRPPYGNGFSGAALSSIRAARTIEKRIKFWDLQPAQEVLVGPPKDIYAAKDKKGNILIYLPTAGEVIVRPGLKKQVPIKFTVIGYLGTQRSETLQPPYQEEFRLFTEEERGGWMLLELLEETL